MGILERSKVKLSVVVDRDGFQPGEALTGNVHLDVKETISFCALRMHLRGREFVEVFVQRGTGTMVVSDELMYLNSWITFTGPCKRSHSRERQTYEPGCYNYPFSIPLNSHLPPSLAVMTSAGRVSIRYSASVVLEIPNSFDATAETDFRVLSVVPLHQYSVRQQPAAAVVLTLAAHTYRHKWLSCLWGREKHSTVRVDASLTPGVIALRAGRTAATGGAPDSDESESGAPGPAECAVRLKITNGGADELPRLRVELVNVAKIQYDMHESSCTTVVARADIKGLQLAPGEERVVEVPLRFTIDDCRTTMEKDRLPAPSLLTPFVASVYALKVRFPRSRVDTSITFTGLVDVVDAVSTGAGAGLAVPVHFLPTNGAATETRYVTRPTTVEFPEAEEHLYAAVHEPYLQPGDDVGDADDVRSYHEVASTVDDGSGAAGGDEFGPHDSDSDDEGCDDGQPRVASPVVATPMPGKIVQGSVSVVPNTSPCRGK